jgi:hypothetical protein
LRRVQPQARANHRTYLCPPNEKQEMPWFSTVSTKQTNVAEPALLSEKGLHEGVVHTSPVQIDGKAREWLHTRRTIVGFKSEWLSLGLSFGQIVIFSCCRIGREVYLMLW